MQKRSICISSAACVAAWLVSGRASAQEPNSIDAERFKPAVTHDGFVQLEGSGVRPTDDRWAFGLLLNYAVNPLIVADSTGGVSGRYVGGRLGFDLMASATIAGPFALGLGLPFFLAQTGDASPSFAGLGDLRIVPKLRILDDRELIGLGIVAELRVPTHVGDFAGGARNVVFWPRILLDHRFGNGLRFGVNGGVSLREQTTFANVTAASEFTYGGSLSYRFGGITGKVELGGEVLGGVGLAAAQREELPLEGTLFVKVNPTEEWEITGGPSVGLIPGYGIPIFRGFLGVRFTPTSHDKDHDGVSDSDDKCPDVAEDRDGDHDADGCPEEDADDDHDGIPNADDLCPTTKETINGFQDEDGCPDTGDRRVIYEDGTVKVLENVQFESGSATIKPESYSLLNQVALTLKANPEIKHVRVEGHTDDTGEHDMNMKLSKARAQAVRVYLINRGIQPDRLKAEGYGPDKPLVSGNDEASRAKNRRVEFVVED